MKYIRQDITTIKKGMIAHGVNCQKKMGSGVALAIKNKWPKIYINYMNSNSGHAMLGESSVITVEQTNPIYVANCYTQEFYGHDGKRYASPDAIKKSLTDIYELSTILEVDIYMPKIGAGLGGLDWETEVEPIILELDEQHKGVETYICTID